MQLTCLLTGASGFLGRPTANALAKSFRIVGLCYQRGGEEFRVCDLRDGTDLETLLYSVEPDCVVHLAAYRDPDFCEEHPEEAFALNVEPTRMFCALLPVHVPLVFVSSDYVFDGKSPPYVESDPVAPLNVYGQTKVASESLVLQRERGAVIRVPLLVGAGDDQLPSGFVAQMLSDICQLGEQEVDNSLVRFPTWTQDVAALIGYVLRNSLRGVFHFSGPRGGTRYEFTREIADFLEIPFLPLRPSEAAIPRSARRPVDSHLLPVRLQTLGYNRFTDFSQVIRSLLH